MKKAYSRYLGSFVLLAALVLVLLIWNINAGSVHLPVKSCILTGHGADSTVAYRLGYPAAPFILSAMHALGGRMSVSSFLLQTFFANPIAGPFVLGISSGAKLAVSLVMIFLLSQGLLASSLALIAAAFVGAMISMGFILLISNKVKKMSMLVISGVMIGYICSAITDFVVTFADDSNIVNLHNWSLGSFSGLSWENVAVMAVVVGVALILTFLLSKPIPGLIRYKEVYMKYQASTSGPSGWC